MMLSAGTRTSCRMTSLLCEPFCPIFLSCGPTDSPGVPASTRKADTPEALVVVWSVRAKTVKT